VSSCKIANEIMDIRVFIRLHELINNKQTGNLKRLAEKLEISERSVSYYIAFMKNELKAPIIYNRKLETYLYEAECRLCFIN
jgi:DNA-binding transcriptional LysR family regulator